MAKHGHRPHLCPVCTAPLTAQLFCTTCQKSFEEQLSGKATVKTEKTP